MFENKTFETIMSNMLSYVSERNPDVDIRTGSMVYTAIAPLALELESVYHELDMILTETFVETASAEYLSKHGDQMGVTYNDATFGHYIGEFDVDVEIGCRFSLDKFNYSVIDKIEQPTEEHPYYTCELVCETEGSEPNGYLGDLTPITFIDNLSYAKLTSILIYGEDEEDAEAYRYRIQLHSKNPSIDGNVAQYEEWLNEYDGIGKYKVIPCWNGNNTVKLRILNPENKRASDELIENAQLYFDPPTDVINDDVTAENYPQGRGMGDGKAPIGAIITVDTSTEVPVVIDCELTLKEGYTTPVGVVESVEEYLNSTVLSKTTIGYMPISAKIYAAESVEDVKNLTVTIKGTVMSTSVTPFVESVTLGEDEIAVLDTENSDWGV